MGGPRILIFDEPTASLDTESERAVQIALEKVSIGRTTIWITHNPQQAEKADYVLVFTPEGIAEEGVPKALLNTGGTFSSLVRDSHLTRNVEAKEVDHFDENSSESSQKTAVVELKKEEIQDYDVEKQDQDSRRPADYSLLACVAIIMWRHRRFWPWMLAMLIPCVIGGTRVDSFLSRTGICAVLFDLSCLY